MFNSFGQAKDTADNRRGGKLGEMTGRRNALRNGLSGESLGFCAQGVSSPGAVLRLFHVGLSAVAVPCRSDPNSPRLKSTSEACIDSESLGTSNGKDVAATAATASSAGRGFRLMCTNCAPMSAVTLAGPFESNMQQLFLICSGCSDRLLRPKQAKRGPGGAWSIMEFSSCSCFSSNHLRMDLWRAV